MDNGIMEYEVRYLPVYFPKGMVCCDLCLALETYARRQCRSSAEYLVQPGKHEATFGGRCNLLTVEELKTIICKEEDDGKSDCPDG